MRITTGRFKGRTIGTVRDLSVRPATDKVRQSLFNILTHRMDLAGISVLDLFAGSGGLGFEALSRGAAHATFVDDDPRLARTLEATARKLGCEGAVTVVRSDAVRYIAGAHGAYTIVFADPPYRWEDTRLLPAQIFGRGLVLPGGLLLVEHARGLRFAASPLCEEDDQRTYGRTVVTIFRRAAENGTHETACGDLSGNV